MKRFLYNYLLVPLLIAVGTLWFKSLRIECKNPEAVRALRESGKPHILTCWHQHLILMFYYLRGWNDLTILISPSADGDIAAGLCDHLGFRVVRGSSYKQPLTSSRGLVKTLRQNLKIAVIADGSRGPRHVAQPGILRISQVTGAPYTICAWDARWKLRFNSWDHFLLPLPFSRCRIAFGPTLPALPKGAGGDLFEERRQEFENALMDLTRQVKWN